MRKAFYASLLIVFSAPVASALAADSGGVSAPSEGSVTAPASPQGAAPLVHIKAPSVHQGQAPMLKLNFEAVDAAVAARLVVTQASGNIVVGRVGLGAVAAGQDVEVPWPAGSRLAAGRYTVAVHAADSFKRQLRRPASAPGKATLIIKPGHAQHPAATPPASAAPTPSGGAFPIAGAYTFGEPFGAPRKGYTHQGQDMAAAEGTAVIAPRRGTISSTDYQASAAGEYIVMTADNGQAYFFAHCQRHSTAVKAGEAVARGAAICKVGSTGRSTGPHLHFEIWEGGWRVDAGSHPIDPLPQLKAWAR